MINRRQFLRASAGLFILAAPAVYPAAAQMWPFPGPGRAASGGGGGGTISRNSNQFQQSNSAGSSIAVNVSTTGANRTIICFVHSVNTGLPVISGLAGASLTWTRIGTAQTSATLDIGFGNARQSIDVFWALATTAITAQAVTATFSAAFDAATINCSAWNNVNTTTPVDPNASIPKLGANGTTTATAASVTGVSTNSSGPVILAAVGSQDATTWNIGTGYTSNVVNLNANSFAFEALSVQYQIFASAQSSISVAFNTGDTGRDWLMQAVALQN